MATNVNALVFTFHPLSAATVIEKRCPSLKFHGYEAPFQESIKRENDGNWGGIHVQYVAM